MRGVILVFVVIGLLTLGCAGEQPPENLTNISDNVTPVINCTGPVCGVDDNTYQTDCDADERGVEIAYEGPCEEVIEQCSDSDGGLETGVKGTTSKGDESHDDFCIDPNQLAEYTCIENSIAMTAVLCQDDAECENGVCVSRPPPPPPEPEPVVCEGPIEAYILAQDTTEYNNTEFTDICVDFTTVKDYYCKDNEVHSINNQCPPGYGCQDGACLLISQECVETDLGLDLFARGKTTVSRGMNIVFSDWDDCIDEAMLLEHYCLENGSWVSEEIQCSSGYKCASDKCIRSRCNETDGGLEITKTGVTTFDEEEYEDECIDEDEIREYYCYGDDVRSVDKDCGPGYICNVNRCTEGSIKHIGE